jgi:hypothetical protein
MKGSNSIGLLFLIGLFCGCSHYITNTAGYIRPPQNYKFSYAKKAKKLTTSTIIDTTAIYYLYNSNFYRNSNKYKNTNNYIRFYATGQFKLQGIKIHPKLEDINNTNVGLIGYYKLKGNVIKMQIYSDIDGGSIQLKFGLIEENGNLVILNENPKTYFQIGYSEKGIKRKIKNSYFNPKYYQKIYFENMTYDKPDW